MRGLDQEKSISVKEVSDILSSCRGKKESSQIILPEHAKLFFQGLHFRKREFFKSKEIVKRGAIISKMKNVILSPGLILISSFRRLLLRSCFL